MFSLDRVNFLPGSSCSAVHWISCENHIDNTGLLELLLGSACTVRDSSAGSSTGSSEGTQLGQMTSAYPKDVPDIFHSVRLSNKTGETWPGDGDLLIRASLRRW